jgi:DNA-binding transcriptional ArsR family regulator
VRWLRRAARAAGEPSAPSQCSTVLTESDPACSWRRPVDCVPLLLRSPLVTLMRDMNEVLQALADPSRRTVLEILRSHPATAGEIAAALPIARPGVSRHLRVLREVGLVDVRQEAQRRIYTLRPEALVEVDQWLEPYRALWRNRLDALHTEIARGKKERK